MKKLLLILALCAVPAACNVLDSATPEEKAKIAALEQAEADALAAGDEGAAAAAAGERGQLETSIGKRAISWVIDTIDAFVPIPLAPFKEEIASFFVLMIFKRPRKHVIAGLKAIAKLDPKEAAMSFMRTFGLKHSNEKARDVAAAAIKLARKEGAEELAIQFEAVLAKLDAAIAAKAAQAAIEAAPTT